MERQGQIWIRPDYFEQKIKISMGINPAWIAVEDLQQLLKNVGYKIWLWRMQFIIIDILKELVEKEKREEVNRHIAIAEQIIKGDFN